MKERETKTNKIIGALAPAELVFPLKKQHRHLMYLADGDWAPLLRSQ